MSSVNLTNPTNEAFADIKEELTAEAAADPTKKKLGALFWICAGWIVLVALAATFANLLPLPNPNFALPPPSRNLSRQTLGKSLTHVLPPALRRVQMDAQAPALLLPFSRQPNHKNEVASDSKPQTVN